MKGRQLTLEEVLNLEDGTKVWVEPIGKEWKLYKDDQYEAVFRKDDDGLYDFQEKNGIFTGCFDYDDNLNITKFTDGFECAIYIVDKNDRIIYLMSQEICNLRGLDLTEDNIDKIMKEFVDKE